MSQEQMYCLRWNNHFRNFVDIFGELYKTECLTDVTLCTSDGPPIKCHKMVLAACSPYFHEMFLKHPQEPAFCLIHGIKYAEMRGILEYVYSGSINVKEVDIPRLVEAAKDLKIKGLSEDSLGNYSTVLEPESPPPPRHPVASTSGLTNGYPSSPPPVRSPTYSIPMYGQSPIDRFMNTHALNTAFSSFVPMVQQRMTGHQPSSRGSRSSSYDTLLDTSPLSRKKQLANREMPILRDVLARREEAESEQYANSNGSPHDSDRRNSAEFSESMNVEDEAGAVNGVLTSRGPRAERGRGSNGKNGPEWKRYKQYTREDIQSAMSVVKDKKMSALQAARQYGVPSRTLYDKLKKAGILPSRGASTRRESASASMASSCDGSARFPYPNELNGTVYGNGRDAHSEGDSDTNNGPINDSIYSAMMLHAVANRREEQQSSDDMVMDMSTHSSPSPSSSRHRSDSLEDQVEDLSVSRVAADVAVISRAVGAVLEAVARDAAKEETEERSSPPAV